MTLVRDLSAFVLPFVAAQLLACGAAEGTETSDATSSAGTAGSNESTSDGGGSSDAVGWPDCQPVTLTRYGFSLAVGLSQDVPAGELLTALCVFRSISVDQLAPAPPQIPDGAWDHAITVDDCVDAEGEAINSPLGAAFVTGEVVELALADGDEVEIQLGYRDVGDFASQVWYSVRSATDRELVFAAFGDLGPTVGPKLPGQSAITTWVAPLEVELGPFACGVDNTGACASPRRAFAHFTVDGQTTDIVSGSIADVGPYRVHLGYAGDPDVCEGSPTNMPIEGLVFARPG